MIIADLREETGEEYQNNNVDPDQIKTIKSKKILVNKIYSKVIRSSTIFEPEISK